MILLILLFSWVTPCARQIQMSMIESRHQVLLKLPRWLQCSAKVENTIPALYPRYSILPLGLFKNKQTPTNKQIKVFRDFCDFFLDMCLIKRLSWNKHYLVTDFEGKPSSPSLGFSEALLPVILYPLPLNAKVRMT